MYVCMVCVCVIILVIIWNNENDNRIKWNSMKIMKMDSNNVLLMWIMA